MSTTVDIGFSLIKSLAARRQEPMKIIVVFSTGTDVLLPAVYQSGGPHVDHIAYPGWPLGVPLDEFIEVNTANLGRPAMDAWSIPYCFNSTL